MPTLQGTVSRFSHTFLSIPDGQPVRGVIKPPAEPRISYDSQFPPRLVLSATPDSGARAGLLIQDQNGTRFLVGRWMDDYFGERLVATHYVLFGVNSDLAWTRAITTTEPISGLQTVTGEQPLGTIACLSEVTQHKAEATNVLYDLTRVLCNAAVQLEDRINKKRVTRVYQDLGLTYAETV